MSPPKLKVSPVTDALRMCSTLGDIARLLQIKPSALAYVLRKIPDAQKYTQFEIAKKGGGKRLIEAPSRQLRAIQRKLAKLLSNVLSEIEGPTNPKKVPAHGFMRGRSIMTNAAHHVRRRHVFNLDLVDFFPSFNFGRVRGFLISNKSLKLHPDAATVIAQICCHQGRLPQGAPSSPVVTNLICRSLDNALVRYCQKHGAHYTRYADDITISTNTKYFPEHIALHQSGSWQVSDTLAGIIGRYGFSVNPKKTRMSSRKGRQSVTGLVVNKKVNISRNYYRDVRAMVDRFVRFGQFDLNSPLMFPSPRPKARLYRARTLVYSVLGWGWISKLETIVSFVAKLLRGSTLRKLERKKPRPSISRKLPIPDVSTISAETDEQKQKRLKREIEIKKLKLLGLVSHIYNVKSFSNNIVVGRGIHKDASRLFFYDLFWGSDRPIIVSEGKTDNIYLKQAIKSFGTRYPSLYDATTSQFKIRFFNHDSLYAEVLQLRGGEGDIKNFLPTYHAIVDGLHSGGGKAPVVFLVDNDSAGAKIYSTVKNSYKKEFNKATGAKGEWITKNLYLMSTEPIGTAGDSCIEDHFSDSLLATVLDKRTFVYKTKVDPVHNYDKVTFANQVVRKMATPPDFAKFEILLDRLSDVVAHHVR